MMGIEFHSPFLQRASLPMPVEPYQSRTAPAEDRLHSLDAYRGLIMVTLAFVGFGLAETAKNHLKDNPDSPLWQNVEYQFSHVEWLGCSYWDLIQPSFM